MAATGCTVVLLPAGTVASGEVRGGAPGTREWALLAPERTVSRVDAVLLSGGSAFGLAAGDGVSRWCEERGIGYPTPAGPVPIVVGAVLYDLDVGDASRRPGAAEGYQACVAAEAVGSWLPAAGGSSAPVAVAARCLGPVGAAAGARLARHRGPDGRRPGALGWALHVQRDLQVGALMAVNAMGDVLALGRQAVSPPVVPAPGGDGGQLTATTIGVVVTNAGLDKLGCYLVAQSAHDGLARALDPAHSSADGDAVVAAATGEVDAGPDAVRMAVPAVVEAAIRAAASAG